MATIDLSKYGITGTEVVYNLLMRCYLKRRPNRSWKATKDRSASWVQ